MLVFNKILNYSNLHYFNNLSYFKLFIINFNNEHIKTLNYYHCKLFYCIWLDGFNTYRFSMWRGNGNWALCSDSSHWRKKASFIKSFLWWDLRELFKKPLWKSVVNFRWCCHYYWIPRRSRLTFTKKRQYALLLNRCLP